MNRLLLLGGGHSHLFMLEALIQQRPAGVATTLVAPYPLHAYSGMLPGVIGLRYEAREMLVPLAALCAAAGVTFVEGTVTGFDPSTRTATLTDGRTFSGDAVSIATGATVRGLDLPGVATHALTVKPINRALAIGERLDEAAGAGDGMPVPVVVVGGGAAGCELAWAAAARLRQRGATPAVTIVDAGSALIPERGGPVRAAAQVACDRLGVAVQLNSRVAMVDADAVRLADGRRLPARVTIWSAGAQAPAGLAQMGLPCTADGFLRVGPTLAVPGHPGLFAAGDVATPDLRPATPKAGVYAVRAGPVLAANLLAAVRGEPATRIWTPQDDYLALLNTGDGRAILSWRGLVAEGAWAMRLKDGIDRRFMRRFARLLER